MLQHENISPNKLAYDRPSEKLIKFLGKHYGLYKYIP
jgi:alpha-tubulin N-acetyltransferase 1